MLPALRAARVFYSATRAGVFCVHVDVFLSAHTRPTVRLHREHTHIRVRFRESGDFYRAELLLRMMGW